MDADTLIVGAGAAGSVLAARLSEDPGHQVLLLEAGPDYGAPDSLPADLADGTRNSMVDHDWGIRHRPVREGGWGRHPFPRGRVVGGSSAVNTCIALRGMPYDYDEWADRGLPGWSWENVLPYFKKLETDLDFGDRAHHGDGGPLPVRRHPPDEIRPWSAAFLEATAELGFPPCEDHNAPDAEGVGPHAMNKLDGRRISAAEAWLTPAVRARDNLTIMDRSLARKVVFEGQRAVGVELDRHGIIEIRYAPRILLCAGAVATPGILLRSGVGPDAELSRLGVARVAVNEGVGARLLDHPGSAIFFRPRLLAPTSRHDPVIQVALRLPASNDDRPNTLQIQAGNCVPTPWADLPLVSLMCHLAKPKTAGRIRWPSADPAARPVIDSDFWEHSGDLDAALDALRLMARLGESKPLAALGRRLFPRTRTLRSRDRLERYLGRATDSGYHPCGTVPMGAEGDEGVACDGQGRVFGVDGLRVADASLMPTVPSSNIHVPTLMIAERLADLLRSRSYRLACRGADVNEGMTELLESEPSPAAWEAVTAQLEALESSPTCGS